MIVILFFQSDSSDLIFDDAPSISAAKLQHPVIQEKTQNDGWLSHNFKRIKRQLWGWPFSSSSETTTSAPSTTESVVTAAPEATTAKTTPLFGGFNLFGGFLPDKETKTEEQPSSTTTNDELLYNKLFGKLDQSTTTEKSASNTDRDVPAQLLDNESELTESREKRTSNEEENNNYDQVSHIFRLSF